MVVHRSHVLVFALTLALPVAAAAASAGWIDVPVRVYNTSNLQYDLVDRALVVAEGALAPAAVYVDWRRCPPERIDIPETTVRSPMCARPLRAGELAVRVVPMPVPRGYSGTLPLGDALVNRNSGAGVLATVYADRVIWLAKAAGTDLTALLGRAIAHELGHLLMGTSGHGLQGGLMRAVWTREELRWPRPEDWQLATSDVARIRSRAIADIG